MIGKASFQESSGASIPISHVKTRVCKHHVLLLEEVKRKRIVETCEANFKDQQQTFEEDQRTFQLKLIRILENYKMNSEFYEKH